MEAGTIRPIRIDEEMKGAYLDYAMSVITARALPDVRDGLKPVQRRILYGMHELAVHPTGPHRKSARIVGDVLGKYHPHGDASVYDTMVRMAQDFSLRYMLVDGQGNFGSVDGDPPAAMRYTEARLSFIAEEMLADIDKDTVDFAPNFDDTLKEPSVLPAKLPNLLVNGTSGIAVGMATNIPPHNLGEVVDALTFVLARLEHCLLGGVPSDLLWARVFNQPVEPGMAQAALAGLTRDWTAQVKERAGKLAKNPTADDQGQALLQVVDECSDVLPEELLPLIQGPDFPTAGIIQGVEGIRSAYATGHGRVTLRARVHQEDIRGSRQQLVVTELPFQLNKTTLLEKIADLVREKRVEGISELRDESDREGMRIVIELKRDASARQVLNQLYRYTQMQGTFSINMLALVDGQPRVLTLKMLLLHYINYRRQVIARRTQHDLDRARARAHILEGLKIALDNLDEVIALIRRSRDAETARNGLIHQFKLTEVQAQAILDMQLRRLAALERRRIIEELEAVRKLIAGLEDLLAHPAKILGVIREELAELKTKFGDARRTAIVTEEAAEFREEDLIPKQDAVVLFTAKGYVRRVVADSFLSRRGRGQTAVVTQEEDAPRYLARVNTHDTVLLFSDRARVFAVRVHELPDAGRTPRGLPVSNFVSIESGERVVAALPQPNGEGARFFLLATRQGEVKRIAAPELANARSSAIQVMGLAEGDELVTVGLTDGKQEMVLLSATGQALRFAEADLRASGRGSGGVRGIRLSNGDSMVAAMLAEPEGELVLVTAQGFAKRTDLSEYPVQGRGGSGVKATTTADRTGPVAGGAIATAQAELVLASAGGLMIRSTVESYPKMGRSAQGRRMSELAANDTAAGLWSLNGKSAAPEPEEALPPAPAPDGAAAKPARAAPGRSRAASARGPAQASETEALAKRSPRGSKAVQAALPEMSASAPETEKPKAQSAAASKKSAVKAEAQAKPAAPAKQEAPAKAAPARKGTPTKEEAPAAAARGRRSPAGATKPAQAAEAKAQTEAAAAEKPRSGSSRKKQD